MVRLALLIAAIVSFVPSGDVAASQSGTPVVDPFGPGPEECQVAPRTAAEMQALLGDGSDVATPPADAGTPGGTPRMRTVPLPEGTRADTGAVAAITDTARQFHACRNAGDVARYLALFSDAAIRRVQLHRDLARLVARGAAPPPSPGTMGQPRHFPGLFHARVLPDGRVAAVAPPSVWGVPELYTFVRGDDRWLIDDIAPLDGPLPEAFAGVVSNTYTGERRVAEIGRPSGGYGYGLSWGPVWDPMVKQEGDAVFPDILALANGVSLVVVGLPFAAPETTLAECIAPEFSDLATALQELGLDQSAVDLSRGITPVLASDGQPLRGQEEDRAFAVYDVASGAEGTPTASEPYRLYLECRAMANGDWALGITHLVRAAAFETEAPAREALLAALEG
jgi:hypothetical protein